MTEEKEKKVYYWLNDRRQFGKCENGLNYLLENDEWVRDNDMIIIGKQLGYDRDEPDDSPYKTGSTSELKTLEVLTEEQFINKYHEEILKDKERLEETLRCFTDDSREVNYSGMTVDEIKDYLIRTKYNTLADVYADVYMRWKIEEDNTYDYEEDTEEFAKAMKSFSEWDQLRDHLENIIGQIVVWLKPDLKEENRYSMISTFMTANGYTDSGFYQKCEKTE